MNKVVVTGASGFLGRHLVAHLLDNSVEVYAIVRRSGSVKLSNTQSNLQLFHEIVGNISDYATLAALLPTEADALIHLAWSGVSPEQRNSTTVQADNIQICMDAVYLAAQINAQRFILPGSTMEYVHFDGLINEKAVPSPQNAYGSVKIAVRYMCQSLCKELEVPFIYVVITGIYGSDRRDNNVISYTITQLLAKKRPSVTALEQKWDYVHIDDVVHALFLIAMKGKASAFYTIGHGDNWALANYIYLIRDLIDPTLPLGIGDVPYVGDKLPSSCVDLTSITADTGFVPRISFEEGIRVVINEFANDINLD